ncbi:MAG: hypothetical protein WCH65_06825 [bacterium]
MKIIQTTNSNLFIEKLRSESREHLELLELLSATDSISGLRKVYEAIEKYFKGDISEDSFNNILSFYTDDVDKIKQSIANEFLLKFINNEISEEDFNKTYEVIPALKAKYSMYQRSLKNSNEISDVFIKGNNNYNSVDSHPEEKTRP